MTDNDGFVAFSLNFLKRIFVFSIGEFYRKVRQPVIVRHKKQGCESC